MGWRGIDRRAHWLARNKSSRRPEAILFLDTEASIKRVGDRREVHTFRLAVGCFCTYSPDDGLQPQEWRDLARSEDLWDWVDTLSEGYKELLVIAHNIDYDSRIVRAFISLPQRGWSPDYLITARTCSLYIWKRGKKKILLADNMNWFNATLAQLGQNVGLPKLEVDFETVTDEALAVYCRRDVEILVKWWQRWLAFLDEHDLGNFGITISKQAFNAFKHKFLKAEIGIHNHSTAMALERDAYHGGRVECFRVGKLPPGTYYKVDVNSLYPAMMRWYPMPTKLVAVRKGASLEGLDYLLHDHCVIAEVVLEARSPIYVKELAGRNVYPTGSFFTTLTTPELEMALINNEVKGIGRVAVYEQGDIFSEYVDYFYDLKRRHREQGDGVNARLSKMFLNSLPGKLGQRGYKQKVVGEAPIDEVWAEQYWDVDTQERYFVYCFGGVVIEQRAKGEPYDSFPAIPAHIDAYGRVYMWSLIQAAGRENTYYIDTDCLLVNEDGYRNLAGVMDPGALGMLKLEGTAEDVEIFAKKDYRFGAKHVVKGVKSNAVELDDHIFEQWHFTTIKYAFKSHRMDSVDLFKVKKQIHYQTLVGTVKDDGRVRPPRLHLNPQDLFGYVSDYETGLGDTWEFDSDWLKRVESLEHLRERATYELNLLPKAKGQKQPAPLALEPVGA